MQADPHVVALVARAREGDQRAWDEIVDRYAPLLWSIGRRYRLDRRDIDDVAQEVWLRLVENLAKLREAGAIGAWITTITKRECLRVSRARRTRDGVE